MHRQAPALHKGSSEADRLSPLPPEMGTSPAYSPAHGRSWTPRACEPTAFAARLESFAYACAAVAKGVKTIAPEEAQALRSYQRRPCLGGVCSGCLEGGAW